MNRRDFIKSLPFIGALIATTIKPELPKSEVVATSDIRTESMWSVVDLGKPISSIVTWNDRVYAIGADDDIWMSSDCFATWAKVECGRWQVS